MSILFTRSHFGPAATWLEFSDVDCRGDEVRLYEILFYYPRDSKYPPGSPSPRLIHHQIKCPRDTHYTLEGNRSTKHNRDYYNRISNLPSGESERVLQESGHEKLQHKERGRGPLHANQGRLFS